MWHLRAAFATMLLSIQFWSGAAHADGSISLKAVLSKDCLLSEESQTPTEALGNNAKLSVGVAIAAQLIPIIVETGIGFAINKFVDSAKDEDVAASDNLKAYLYAAVLNSEIPNLVRSPGMRCLTIVGMIDGAKVTVEGRKSESGIVKDYPTNWTGKTRSERLGLLGFRWDQRDFPDFVAEIELITSSDSTAAYAVLRHLDIEFWPGAKTKESRLAPRTVVLTLAINDPVGGVSNFILDLGDIKLFNADQVGVKDHEMLWERNAPSSDAFLNSYPSWKDSRKAPPRVSLAETEWVGIPGLNEERLVLARHFASNTKTFDGRQFGPVNVTASVLITQKADKWRKDLANALSSDAGTKLVKGFSAGLGKSLVPASQSEQATAVRAANVAVLKIELDMAKAELTRYTRDNPEETEEIAKLQILVDKAENSYFEALRSQACDSTSNPAVAESEHC